MKVKPLSAAEKKWLAEMQALLNKCPSKRFGFFTTGDFDVSVVDLPAVEAWEVVHGMDQDYTVAVQKAGALLGSLNFPANVQSTSG